MRSLNTRTPSSLHSAHHSSGSICQDPQVFNPWLLFLPHESKIQFLMFSELSPVLSLTIMCALVAHFVW